MFIKTVAFCVAILIHLTAFGQLTQHSYAFKKVYTSKITKESLEKTPSWMDKDDSPPLLARMALKLADKLAASLVTPPSGYKRRLVALSLMPDNISSPEKWYWEVRYEWHPVVGGGTGIPDELEVVVLMDGTVVQPDVDDWKSGPVFP